MDESKIIKLKNKFYNYNNKNDYEIIAINLFNKNKELTWYLFNIKYIKIYEEHQQVLIFNNKIYIANKYSVNTKIIKKNNSYLISNSNFNNEKIIAEVKNKVKNGGKTWELIDETIKFKLIRQSYSLNINNHIYISKKYKEEVFFIKNKFSGNVHFCNYKGQVILKKD